MSIEGTQPRLPGGPIRATLEVIDASDNDAWSAVLSQTQHDVYHLAGYHRLAEYRAEGDARLFVYREGRHLIALPLLIRAVDEAHPDGLQDATSVYGYAGPVASDPRPPRRMVRAFQSLLREEIERQRIVAVFSRLHPILEQEHLLIGLGETHQSGLTVSVDLSLSEQGQWEGYSKGLRRLIRRGLEAGVVCVHDEDMAHLHEWTSIYRETMDRVAASDSYRFDAEYFVRMVDELGPALHLFMAFVDGRPAAGGLYTICGGIVQAHLGGSRRRFLEHAPVRIIDDTARRWAAGAGARVFHLGGGVSGRQDSLFKYKATFSDRRHAFATWRWVVDADAYDHLCQERAAQLDDAHSAGTYSGFFPAYRDQSDLPRHGRSLGSIAVRRRA